MNINLLSTDSMVGEYLIYRGFTSTFQSLEAEKSRDRTKRFEVSKLVETVFTNLQGSEMESFVTLWDFLNKRFFFHLDSEHLHLCNILKVDLIKFHLVHCVKSKQKARINDFFSMYSHEILAETGASIPGHLRTWFVLPYLEEPEKDPEFAAYFTSAWSEMLKTTLHNFLSVVLNSAPPPKLLLLEKWFRSEAQQEIRAELKLSAKKIDSLIHRVEEQEDRLHMLRITIKDLTTALLAHSLHSELSDREHRASSLETDKESVSQRRLRSKELGIVVSECAVTCLKHTAHLQGISYEQRLLRYLGAECSAMLMRHSAILNEVSIGEQSPEMTAAVLSHHAVSSSQYPPSTISQCAEKEASMEQLELNLISAVHLWLDSLS